MNTSKDLSKEPPRSPSNRLGGYALMARMIDKGRATLAGTAGEYHYACPLDQMLFGFKSVEGDDVKTFLTTGATDAEVVTWFESHGAAKTETEIAEWSGQIEGFLPYENPEKKEWFIGECAKLGLDPKETTLAGYLDADDVASFKAA